MERRFESYRRKIEASLKAALPNDTSGISRVMRYSVLGAGKRLRPMLFIAAYESLGGLISRAVLRIACAIEFIHSFSLIQDDLPAMDNDDYRRGRLTAHKAFKEDIALLASDALLNEAYRITLENGGIEEKLRVKTALELTRAVNRLLEGQEKDLSLSRLKPRTLSELDKIYLNKTAALITCCLRIAGILRGVSDSRLNCLSSFGQRLGLAFQIQDDILNVTGDKRALRGKRFSDQRWGKITYVSIAGIKKSKGIVTRLIKEAKKDLEKIKNLDKGRLLGFCEVILRRTY
ncbi:polyprenyl synthetase family protein [bacterium]|nr:MAG: polyprenyl synthetase family protein [bacterium]